MGSPNDTNSTNGTGSSTTQSPSPTLPNYKLYENRSMPLWGFDSLMGPQCDWEIATYINAIFSTFGVINNGLIFLMPFIFMRLHDTRGVMLCSYAIGALFSCGYFMYFDIRYLTSSEMTNMEKGLVYWLMHFQVNQVVLHLTLISWDQYKRVFQCNAHLRYINRSRLAKLIGIIWTGASALPVVEGCFMANIYSIPFTKEVSQFRLVCVLLISLFLWFMPMITVILWNAGLFRLLLRIAHNGYKVEEPKSSTPTAPSPQGVIEPVDEDEDYYDEDPEEYPTVPDDIRAEYIRCYVHIVLLTVLCALFFIWHTYNTLALLRTADMVNGKAEDFYFTIYNCYIYIGLYFLVRLVPILNPLGLYYYRIEFNKIFCYTGKTRRQNYSRNEDETSKTE